MVKFTQWTHHAMQEKERIKMNFNIRLSVELTIKSDYNTLVQYIYRDPKYSAACHGMG
jgi:hypothetical protein